MPVPLAVAAGIPAALGLLSIYSQFQSGKAQQRFQEKQLDQQRKDARRAAIERSLSSKYSSPIGVHRPSTLEPPDTSNYAIMGGLADLGSNLAGRYFNYADQQEIPKKRLGGY